MAQNIYFYVNIMSPCWFLTECWLTVIVQNKYYYILSCPITGRFYYLWQFHFASTNPKFQIVGAINKNVYDKYIALMIYWSE